LTTETKNTITDLDVLRTELRATRKQGFALSHGERVDGAIGVSAPVLDANDRALAALSVLGPADRLVGNLPEVQRLVIATSQAIRENILESMTS
jgi:DNA-binding IclR family transcriptional regulator